MNGQDKQESLNVFRENANEVNNMQFIKFQMFENV